MAPEAREALLGLQAATPETHFSENLVENLIALYCYCLELEAPEECQRIVLYLLTKYQALIAPDAEKLPHLLSKHPERVLPLIKMMWSAAGKSLSLPLDPYEPVPTVASQCMSVKHSIEVLFDAREEGDFDLVITATKHEYKAHSYVLYAGWPYFRLMYDTGMRERHAHRLELGTATGGILPEVLELIIELCYHPDALETMDKRVDAILALHILHSAMYLRTSDTPTTAVEGLLQVAQHQAIHDVKLDNCIAVFKQATDFLAAEVALAAEKIIVEELATVLASDDYRKQLAALPQEMQLHLLWKSAHKLTGVPAK